MYERKQEGGNGCGIVLFVVIILWAINTVILDHARQIDELRNEVKELREKSAPLLLQKTDRTGEK